MFAFPGTLVQYVDEFRRYYGPAMNAFEATEKSGRAAAPQGELESLFEEQNKSGNATKTKVEATFLRVTVSVR